MKSVLAENISFGYSKKELVFSDVSFELKSPNDNSSITAIMGSSGSGKSTLLKLLLNIKKVTSGLIIIKPKTPVISYLPQEPILFEHLTANENASYFSHIPSYRNKFNKELFRQLTHTLDLVNILEKVKSVNELSGGQKQRLSLLRALSIQPDFLLLDEPLTGMDEEVKENFLIKLLEVIHVNKIMVLYVTHHSKEVEMVANQILYLSKSNDSNIVQNIMLSDVKTFLKAPPNISALKTFSRKGQNTIKCVLDEENKLILLIQSDIRLNNNFFFLSFDSQIVNFSNSSGFIFETITNTDMYVFIKIKNSGTIISIEKEYFSIKNGANNNFFFLTGSALMYDSAGHYDSTVLIDENTITNKKK